MTRPPKEPRGPRRNADGTPRPRKRVYDPDKHCGGEAIDGNPCTNLKGRGTDHPGFGKCRFHLGNAPNLKQAAAKEAATKALTMLGIPIPTDPVSALRAALDSANGIHAAVERLLIEAATGEADMKAIGVRLSLYGEAIDRLARVAKLTVDANISERHVRIAEQQGTLIVEILRRALARAGLPSEQRSLVEKALGAELREYAATAPEGS